MNGTTWGLSSVWRLAGWTMLHYLWVGGVMAALAAAGRRMLRQVHPDVRYGYAVASLTTLAVAPAFIAWTISRGPSAPATPPRIASGLGPILAAVDPTAVPACAAVVVTPFPRSQADAGRVALWLDSVAVALPGVWLIGAPLTLAPPCHRVARCGAATATKPARERRRPLRPVQPSGRRPGNRSSNRHRAL